MNYLPGSPVSEVQVGAYFYRSLSPLFNKSFDPKDKKGVCEFYCLFFKLSIIISLLLLLLLPTLPSA